MTSIRARNHLPFDFEPTLNDVAVGWGSYTTGELINGSKGNLKAWAHIFDARPIKILTAVTTATNTTITTQVPHGLVTGNWIAPRKVKTNTGINNGVYQVTVTSTTVFTIAYTTGTASGTGGELFKVLKSAVTDANPTGVYLKELILTLSSDADIATYDLYEGIEEQETNIPILIELWRFFTDDSGARISDLKGDANDGIMLLSGVGP